MAIREGDAWGALICTKKEYRRISEVTSPGITEEWDQGFVHLECKCGKKVEIDLRNFPGRVRMKDCGCGISQQLVGRRHRAEPHSMVSVYVETEVLRRVWDYATAHRLSAGKAFEELAKIALAGM